MSNLRKKYASTSVEEIKKIREKENSAIGKDGGSKNEFLKLKDGVNKLRLYPKHESEEGITKMKCCHWLTVEDDGKERRTNVPNSRIHANTPKDIIDEYIKFVKNKLSKSDDADDQAKIKLLSSRDKGIHMKTSWLCYADLIKGEEKEFGIFEMKKSCRDGMLDLMIIEDDDEAFEQDVFTDPDEGKPILVTYNSKAKQASDYYKTALSKKPVPLTDEELERYDSVTPLSELSMFKYGRKEFEKSLEGLRFFDEENEINLFDTDDFQEIVSEVSSYYGDDETEDKPKKKSVKKPLTKKAPEPEEEEEEEETETEEEENGDEFDEMDREELKAYKAENEIDTFTVKKSMTDDEIRDNIREWKNSKLDDSEEEAEEEEEEEAPAPKKTGLSKLDQIRKKLGK